MLLVFLRLLALVVLLVVGLAADMADTFLLLGVVGGMFAAVMVMLAALHKTSGLGGRVGHGSDRSHGEDSAKEQVAEPHGDGLLN